MRLKKLQRASSSPYNVLMENLFKMKWKPFFLSIGAIMAVTAATTLTRGQTPATQPAQTAPAAQKTKVALLSYLALREEIQELKQKYQKLQAEFAPRATELDSMQNSIESKEKVLNENRSLTPQQAQKLAQEVEQLKRDYKRKAEDSQEAAKKRENEETLPVLEKISTFLEKYCQQHNITHVFDVGRLQETGSALYAAPAANITVDFVKEYNKAYPPGSAPAATAPATKTPAATNPQPGGQPRRP
jgi:outer membrane protein